MRVLVTGTALEPLAGGTRAGTGVRGPGSFGAVPFLHLLTGYGSSWAMREHIP